MKKLESNQPIEVLFAETVESVSLNALLSAYKRIVDLGKEGEKTVLKNQFGDLALLADVEAEETVIKALELAQLPIVLISEEHGRIETGREQKLLGVLDGIDGSGLFKKDRINGRYGTMFAVFNGVNPSYDDYIFCGIMEHATRKLYYATKGKGAFVFIDGQKEKIATSGQSALNKVTTRISTDENFDSAFDTTVIFNSFLSKLSGYRRTPRIDATSAHYADLISGACDLVLECTRKGNLELAVGYGLVVEAGGTIIDLKGENIGQKKFLEFGQDKYTPFIAAATAELALKIASFLVVTDRI